MFTPSAILFATSPPFLRGLASNGQVTPAQSTVSPLEPCSAVGLAGLQPADPLSDCSPGTEKPCQFVRHIWGNRKAAAEVHWHSNSVGCNLTPGLLTAAQVTLKTLLAET